MLFKIVTVLTQASENPVEIDIKAKPLYGPDAWFDVQGVFVDEDGCVIGAAVMPPDLTPPASEVS